MDIYAAYAAKATPVSVEPSETLGGGSCTLRYTFWNTFLSSLKPFLMGDLPSLNIIRENNFTYNELPVESMIGTNTMIHGYFQSYKYFQEHFETICKLIGLEKKKQEVLNKLGLKKEDLNNTISMHFRLGDYKKLQDFHPIATQQYYENALNHYKSAFPEENFTILYFCEASSVVNRRPTHNSPYFASR